MIKIGVFMLALAWCVASAAPPAYATTPSTAAIPGHGELTLAIPDGWTGEWGTITDQTRPSLSLRPKHGDPFEVTITTLWSNGPGVGPFDDAALRTTVASWAKDFEGQSVERDLPTKELDGDNGNGFYFTATDRSLATSGHPSGPGDFKYLTMGLMRTGQVALAFTVMTNDGHEGVLKDVFDILRVAEHHPGKPASIAGGGTPPDQMLAIRQLPDAYELSIPVGRLQMTIPRGDFVVAEEPRVGAAASPRYFHLVDDKRGVVISGWFEPANSYRGFDRFWESESSALNKNSTLPPMSNVALLKQDHWEVATYDVAIPRISNAHVRAEWVQAGTWIDLHVSATTSAPIADARDTALSVLRSIRVTELH